MNDQQSEIDDTSTLSTGAPINGLTQTSGDGTGNFNIIINYDGIFSIHSFGWPEFISPEKIPPRKFLPRKKTLFSERFDQGKFLYRELFSKDI